MTCASSKTLRASAAAPLPFRAVRGALALSLLWGACASLTREAVSADSPRAGSSGSLGSQSALVLVGYYEEFVRDQDVERFRRQVSSRYTEGSLARLLESGDVQARRAAVLSLGILGGFETSNAAVGRALRDSDDTVRALARGALWSIWFRADSPENNETLRQVNMLIKQDRNQQAIELATKLTQRAPRFAEAYNQRAIAHFQAGQFEESAADCERVLELNPFHIGALGGLAQCQAQLKRPAEVVKTLRRSLKLQPHDDDLRQIVQSLEAQQDQ